MPLVSVIIPTFGRPQLLARAINSVLSQSMTDFELIVVVDGDDSSTGLFLSTLKEPKLRSIVHSHKQGAGRARDTGVDASLGVWVAFLDDDDEWLPTKLEQQLAYAPSQPAILMTLSKVMSSKDSSVQPADPFEGAQSIDEWLFDRRSWLKGGQSFLQTSSLMMPRLMFKELRFRDTKQHEEWELVIRAVKQLDYALVTVREPLVIYHVPEQRASLSKTYTWTRSIEWINQLGDLISPRAYSGFCLTVAARSVANDQIYSAFFPLIKAAFLKGRPSTKQLLAFFLLWLLPEDLRNSIRRKIIFINQ